MSTEPAASKKHSARRVAIAVLAGLVLLIGVVWLLSLALGNRSQYLFAGHPIPYWQEQLNGRDTGASNQAFIVVNRQVLPQLTDTLFHYTNDSSVRLALIEALNGLPGVQINFIHASSRRIQAARRVGELGPAAKAAVPDLVRALKGKDLIVHSAAIQALGNIHSDPDVIIPLLIGYLDNDDLNDEAALALANYGSLAKAAVPKIIPLLHAPDKDAQRAAVEALNRIDPEAYTNAIKADVSTNPKGPLAGVQEERPGKAK
jgi:hypothetical protein